MNKLNIKKSLEIKNKYNLSYFEAYVLLIIMTYQEETDVFNPNLVYKIVKNYELSNELTNVEKRGKFITLKGCILTDNDIGRILGLGNSRTPINKAINKMKDLGILKIEKYQIYRDSKEWRRIINVLK